MQHANAPLTRTGRHRMVLLGEPDATAVLSALADFDQHVASRLLAVELHRLALRHDVLDHADQLLGAVALVPMDEPVLGTAETVPPPWR